MLQLLHRTYHVRLNVPEDLRQHYAGRSKLVKSLGTDSITVARRMHDAQALLWRREFERLRGATPGAREALAWRRMIEEVSDPEDKAVLEGLAVNQA